MMEFLDFSVPAAGSGKFIELYQTGVLQLAQPLWSKYSRLRKRLEEVKARLVLCNEPAWLFYLAKKCQQQNKDFEKELRMLVERLEIINGSLENQFEKICSELGNVEPSLTQAAVASATVPLTHSRRESCFTIRKSRLDILRRNLVIETNPSLRSAELCKRFDFETIPIPEKWKETFALDSWTAAYQNAACRKLIQKMISDTRRRFRLP